MGFDPWSAPSGGGFPLFPEISDYLANPEQIPGNRGEGVQLSQCFIQALETLQNIGVSVFGLGGFGGFGGFHFFLVLFSGGETL